MITLPWPDRRLSPNAREDRRAIAGVRKSQKDVAFWLAKKAAMHFPHLAKQPHVRVTFHPPDNRRRDLDNMLASVKSALDGVALATGVDDSLWGLTLIKGPAIKKGAVVIECGAEGQFVPFRGVIS
jgi:crossover junction endodeoxyribonuclease RusA